MAEATGLRNNALPYPVYGAPWTVQFPILDADGDLVTGATGLDSEISKNGDTYADCTNEATEVATASGMYYLILTGTELTTDVAGIIVKTSSVGAKTTPMVLYPRKLPTLRTGTSQTGAAGSITLDSGASALDDYYNGCLILATIDSNVEARIISDYVGSTKVASVVPDWNVTPDSDDTFIIKIPEGVQVQDANLVGWLGVLQLALSSQQVQAVVPNTQKVDIETIKTNPVANGGTFTFPTNATGASTTNITAGTITTVAAVTVVNGLAAGVITATSIATGAFVSAKFAADYFTDTGVAVWASATRTLTSYGTLVADIATAVWGAATRVLTAGTNIVLAKGVGVTGFNDISTAQVNAEVLDVMNVDTFAEPTGVPPATDTLANKIGRQHMALRNGLTVDTNTNFKTFLDDGGSAEWKKSVADAGGVYTEGESEAP